MYLYSKKLQINRYLATFTVRFIPSNQGTRLVFRRFLNLPHSSHLPVANKSNNPTICHLVIDRAQLELSSYQAKVPTILIFIKDDI